MNTQSWLDLCQTVTTCAAIVTAVAGGGSYYFKKKKDGESAAKATSTGTLIPRKKKAQEENAALPRGEAVYFLGKYEPGIVYPELRLGGPGGALFRGPRIGEVFARILPLQLGVRDGKLFVSASFFDASGKLVAEIADNEWKVNENTLFDRNYSADRLEVLNDRGEVVFHVQLIGMEMRLEVKTFNSNGESWVVYEAPQGGTLLQRFDPGSKDIPTLKRIFKYPSNLHFGEVSEDKL